MSEINIEEGPTFCLPRGFYEHVLGMLEKVRYIYPTSPEFAADLDLAIGQCRFALAEINKNIGTGTGR